MCVCACMYIYICICVCMCVCVMQIPISISGWFDYGKPACLIVKLPLMYSGTGLLQVSVVSKSTSTALLLMQELQSYTDGGGGA